MGRRPENSCAKNFHCPTSHALELDSWAAVCTLCRHHASTMPPKRAPDLYNSGALLAPREIRVFHSKTDGRYFLKDTEPGWKPERVEVKTTDARDDVLQKLKAPVPNTVADAVVSAVLAHSTPDRSSCTNIFLSSPGSSTHAPTLISLPCGRLGTLVALAGASASSKDQTSTDDPGPDAMLCAPLRMGQCRRVLNFAHVLSACLDGTIAACSNQSTGKCAAIRCHAWALSRSRR